MEFGIFKLIGRVNYQWLKDADKYTNALPGSDKPGKWFSSVEAVDYKRPFHRTTVGHDHTYFILDFDAELLDSSESEHDQVLQREIKLRVCLTFLRDWLDKHPRVKFFARVSGSGIHLIQRHNERIDPQRFKEIPKLMFTKCKNAPIIPIMTKGHPPLHICDETCTGWHHPYLYDKERDEWKPFEKKWTKIVAFKEHRVSITIDLKMFEPIHMIRWTYSPNMKIRHRYNWAIPIDDWSPEWILKHMYRENLSVHDYEIPDFQWPNLLLPEDKHYDMKQRYKDEKSEVSDYYRLDIPEPGEDLTPIQDYHMDKMEAILAADESVVPPCVKGWYEKSRNTAGVYWGRYVWVRWLAAKKYTPEEIGLLMRFRVNDSRDNLEGNCDIIHEQMSKHAFGPRDRPFHMIGCSKLRYHGEPTTMDIKIADEDMCKLCRRNHPLQNYPTEQITGDPDRGFEEIQRKVLEIFDSPSNKVARKATRAGLTTTAIPIAKGLGQKLLVVVPTNRIGKETFVKAVGLAKTKFGLDVNGAMFAANRNSCLILTILDREMKEKRKNPPDPAWSNPLAWSALRYHSKQSCGACKYKKFGFAIPLLNNGIPVPMIDSEITLFQNGTKSSQGNCAYITLHRQIRDLDVVFITYSKLFALFSTNSVDAEYFRQELFECFDVILLDEVSHLTNHSALSIKLLQSKTALPGDGKAIQMSQYSKNLLLDLEGEISDMLNFKNIGTTRAIEKLIRRFIEFYEPMLDDPMTINETPRVDNFFDDWEIDLINDNFPGYHEVIERAALERNISLTNIESVLFLLKEHSWMLSSIPTKFHPVDMTLITEPATAHVKRFVREFNMAHNKQVIVTDATMPYVSMMDFFQIPFEEYEIGDPRGTNKSQLVIADSRSVHVTELFFSEEKSKAFREDLFNYIRMVCNEHGEKNIMIVTANMATASMINRAMTANVLPRIIVTWFRSDMTIGVESDRRIIITICPPHPPRGSHDWLAYYFHQDAIRLDLSISELGAALADNSTKIAFYQAIGRGKDPEVRERSVVYCWGIGGGRERIGFGSNTVMQLMDFDDDVPKPHVLNPSHLDARSEEIIKVGRLWIREGILVNKMIVRIAAIVKHRTQVTMTELSRIMRISPVELEETTLRENLAILKKFDVEEFDLLSRGKKYKGLRHVERISSERRI